jgi:DeoR family transcriptional regulator, fructose operon transcriptional repressor
MLVEQRFSAILQELKEHQAASVSRLCELTGASEATTRRDLNVLAEQGLLSKVHGGAVLAGSAFQGKEQDVSTKTQLFQDEKERIAAYAAQLIHDDDVVFLDSGTTTVRMLPHLKDSKATFVTNSVDIMSQMSALNLRGYCVGGLLRPETRAMVGSITLDALGQFNFTKAFLGTNGITIRQGFSTPDREEAAVKKKASEQAYLTYVLSDASKFQMLTAVTFLPLEKAVIITDHVPDSSYQEHTIVKEV